MSTVIEYLKAAKAAATADYERKIIDDAIFAIQTYEEEHREELKPGESVMGTLQILCMDPCSRCDKIKPYLPATKKLCASLGVAYEYHRDNSYLIKMKKQYKGISSTPGLLFLNPDGSYRVKSPTTEEISTEARWLKCVESFILNK